ncbi:MAG TPA: helix-turn-helix domain-containing protein [Roseiflexaceae bacterium]|nr:helix-turn-helix domain-containing protein [Roseiflexaceae bacterium]
MTSKADLLLHPVRMRIMLAVAGQRLTAQQLSEALPDVAQATLYRQINKLAQGGVLAVVEQRPVRGTVEKVYALVGQNANLTADELAGASREDNLRYFLSFLVGLLGDYERYLRRETIDPLADGVGYRAVPLHLSDEEFRQMAIAVNTALLPFLQHTPAPERRARLLATVSIPLEP